MAKFHSYDEDDIDVRAERLGHLEFESKKMALCDRALESIRDLLDEHARNGSSTILSMEQHHEMDEILKDAIRQGIY